MTDYKSGKPPSHGKSPVLKGGTELQRCLYAFAVSALVPGVEQVEARLLYPKAGDSGLHALSDPRQVLDQLAGFIGHAQRHASRATYFPASERRTHSMILPLHCQVAPWKPISTAKAS